MPSRRPPVAQQPRSARTNLAKLPLCGAGRFAASTERAVADQGGSATQCSSTGSTRKRPCKNASAYGSFFDNRVECWANRRPRRAMGIVINLRHERFAQALAQGKSASETYVAHHGRRPLMSLSHQRSTHGTQVSSSSRFFMLRIIVSVVGFELYIFCSSGSAGLQKASAT
jgi:Viral alkaline exonuclease